MDTNIRPAVAFQIKEKLLGNANDVQSGAEAIYVDAIVADFEFVGFPAGRFQL